MTLDKLNDEFSKRMKVDVEGFRQEDEIPLPARVEALPRAPVPEWGTAAEGGAISNMMLSFRERLAGLDNLYVRASANVYVFGQPTTVGRASFEYWASNDRYYVKAHADRRLGLSADIEASFDGRESRLLMPGDGLMVTDRHAEQPVYSPIPSPIQLPIYFLGGVPGGCTTCIDALTSWTNREMWAVALEGARGDGETLVMAGPTTEANGPTYYVVDVAAGGVVRELEWRDHQNALMVSAKMSAFRSYPRLGAFPSDLVLTSYTRTGDPAASIVYHVKELRTDHGPANQGFRVPEDRAEVIWDNQARRFTKHFDAVAEE